MREAARVPKLAEKNASLVVHSLHNRLPSIDLLSSPNARDVGVSNCSIGHSSRF